MQNILRIPLESGKPITIDESNLKNFIPLYVSLGEAQHDIGVFMQKQSIQNVYTLVGKSTCFSTHIGTSRITPSWNLPFSHMKTTREFSFLFIQKHYRDKFIWSPLSKREGLKSIGWKHFCLLQSHHIKHPWATLKWGEKHMNFLFINNFTTLQNSAIYELRTNFPWICTNAFCVYVQYFAGSINPSSTLQLYKKNNESFSLNNFACDLFLELQ